MSSPSPPGGRSSTTPPSPRCQSRRPRPLRSTPATSPTTASPPYRTWADRVAAARGLAARLLNARADGHRLRAEHHGRHRPRRRGLPLEAGRQRRAAGRGVPVEPVPVAEPARPRGRSPGRARAGGNRVEIDDLRDAMDDRTRVLAISSVEFASGFRNDLDALGELCRARGVFFFVDAIQSLGVLPLDVQRVAHRRAGRRRPQVAARAGRGGHRLRPAGVGRAAAPGRRRGGTASSTPVDFGTIDFRLKPHAGPVGRRGAQRRRRRRPRRRACELLARRRHRERGRARAAS